MPVNVFAHITENSSMQNLRTETKDRKAMRNATLWPYHLRKVLMPNEDISVVIQLALKMQL